MRLRNPCYHAAFALTLATLLHCGRVDTTGSGATPGDDAAPGSSSTPSGTGPSSATDGGQPCVAGATQETDPDNCGRCGHSCQGGACLDGVCQPVTIAPDEDSPVSIAVDGTSVYWLNWTDNDLDPDPNVTTVRALAKATGAITTLGTTAPFYSGSLHVVGNSLFFYRSMIDGTPFNGAGVMQVCTDGSCPLTRVFGPGEDNPLGIAADASNLFFHDDQRGGLVRTGDDGSNPVTIAPDPGVGGYVSAFALDAARVYVLSYTSVSGGGDLLGIARDGSGTIAYAFGAFVDVVSDDQDLFVSDSERVLRVAKNGASTAVIGMASAPLPGNNSSEGPIQAMALDAERVYWVESAPAVLRSVRKDGTGSTSLALPDETPNSLIAVDDVCVYWVAYALGGWTPTVRTGSVMKVAKQ